jgi:POT family proton-dependent oligopeptide transporter
MSKIPNHIKYDRTIFMYAASRALERSAYYGMRSILILYMLNGILSVSENDTMQFYSWFIQGTIAAGVIGAVFGDFVLGNRKALLLGIILMTIGLFLLCVPVQEVFYGSIGLIIIGSGLYTPNLMARFGKQFYTKPELTDGGFTLLYVLVNIGSFIGVSLVSLVAIDNYMLGFVLSGILMLGSALLSFVNKDKDSDKKEGVTLGYNSYSTLIILLTILALGAYWYLYDVSYNSLYAIQTEITEFNPEINPLVWQTLPNGLCMIIGIAVAAVYSFYYFSKALKLAVGFLVSAIALGIALLISFPITQSAAGIMFLVILLISIAELIMAPVIYGVVVQNTNPKYLALVISLTFIPSAVFKIILPKQFSGNLPSETATLITVGSLMACMSLIAFGYWMVKRMKKN